MADEDGCHIVITNQFEVFVISKTVLIFDKIGNFGKTIRLFVKSVAEVISEMLEVSTNSAL